MDVIKNIICARCAQECTADAPLCGCGEPSTLMQPMCTRCWEDRVLFRALSAQLAEALATQIRWNKKPRITFDRDDSEIFEVDMACASDVADAARKAGLIK